jgi:hypothetical protein
MSEGSDGSPARSGDDEDRLREELRSKLSRRRSGEVEAAQGQ